jgi:hypothetical protein
MGLVFDLHRYLRSVVALPVDIEVEERQGLPGGSLIPVEPIGEVRRGETTPKWLDATDDHVGLELA